MSGMTSRGACENATYSLSVAERVISDCSLDDQMMGQFDNEMTYPEREYTDDGSLFQLVFHSPAKDASTKMWMLWNLFG
jgi:hypothetical protein